MKSPLFLLIVLCIQLTSCGLTTKDKQPGPVQKTEPAWNELPQVKNLNSFKRTDFVITLESPVASDRNVIYAPSFLFAWDKVEEALHSGIIVDSFNSDQFKQLNHSNSHLNSLSDSEYVANAEIIDGAIFARAFFNKALPFEPKLEVLDPMLFGNTEVKAFGIQKFNDERLKYTQVCYYEDDDHFVLKLVPKDRQYRFTLVKGLRNFQTLKGAINLTKFLIALGKEDQKDKEQSWKYQINEGDYIGIPSIEFNIETNYKSLEGQSFLTNDQKKHHIEITYQRTGFLLNEEGAVVESQVALALDSASVKPVIRHPKNMVFDKPFVIIIERVDNANPYFVMKVENTELMKRK